MSAEKIPGEQGSRTKMKISPFQLNHSICSLSSLQNAGQKYFYIDNMRHFILCVLSQSNAFCTVFVLLVYCICVLAQSQHLFCVPEIPES